MKKIVLITMAFCLTQFVVAQTPKWADKSKKAVLSVITYGKDGKILNTGNGFFIGNGGVAVADYRLFKNAAKATTVTTDGTEMPVEAILGADEMYDVVKFRVETKGKKLTTLNIAGQKGTPSEKVYILPYSTQKKENISSGVIEKVDSVGTSWRYYTIQTPFSDKLISCPVVNERGEVIGLVQKAYGEEAAQKCCAIDVAFADAQNITALSFANPALSAIGIKKALPDSLKQAETLLYMVAGQLSAEKYMELLNDFIEKFPDSPEGYMRRATQRLVMMKDNSDMQGVEQDMERALQVSREKDDTYYNRAKLYYSYVINTPQTKYQAWSLSKALEEVKKAEEINRLPIYVLLEGDILFAMQDYENALKAYEEVNRSNLVSAASHLSAAKTMQMLKRDSKEVLAQMDSCVNMFTKPYSADAAPYLWERAAMKKALGDARGAVLDYNEYLGAVGGRVNDVFYYYREQAEVACRQYQQALDDIKKAIELNPKEMMYRAELAVIDIRIGRSEEAVKVLDEALKMEPNYAEGYRLKGFALIQLNRKGEACELFHKAKEMGDGFVDELIKKYCN